MLWLLLSGLASPASLELIVRAEILDLRRGESAAVVETLAEELARETGWQTDAWQRLATGTEKPAVRAVLVSALQQADTIEVDRALWLLGASLPADARPLSARLAALDILHHRAPPEAAGPLLLLFARARLDDLPEDPDLFERALRGVLQIDDPAAIRHGLVAVLPGDLLRQVHAHLIQQWVRPGAGDLPPDRLAALIDWPRNNPEACAALEAEAAAQLRVALDTHGRALVGALQTDGGSILTAVTRRMELALLAQWKQGTDPAVARIAEEITAQLSPPAPLAPPDMAPGMIRGLQLVAPVEEITLTPSEGDTARAPGLLAVGLTGGMICLLLGARLPRLRPGVALALGGCLLLTVEGGLRVLGVTTTAESRPLFSFTDWQVEAFRPTERSGEDWLETPGGWMRYQEIAPQRPDFRAIVLGASSAHGSNHLAEESFGALIEDGLQDRFPGAAVEVLNLGIGGTTSGGVLHTGTQALALGVDLVMVYYGHNEAAQFSRLSLFESVDPGQLSARMRLSRSALYSSLLALLRPTQSLIQTQGSIYAQAPPSPAAVDQLRALAAENYRYNLTQLLLRARRSGAEVIMMNPATNYRFAAIEPKPSVSGAALEAGLAEAEAAWGRGDAAETVSHTDRILTDARAAGSAPWLAAAQLQAHALAALGEPEAARMRWQQAIDASAHPGVITTEIRAALQAVVAEQGCAFLDVDALFYARSPDGISAPGLFWDDLHPSRLGHTIIAEALLPAVISSADQHLPPPRP
ncbi:MAG: GDSL-type esterase/lipase family protein [Myxococcota bacterium]|nr:GDSL-type esterase/lipase family protein [Myxococcota bacterium]